jgi:hypothetical protein
MKIHWLRILSAGILIEVALFALTISVTMLIGNATFIPFIPPTVFVSGFLFGWWAVRKIQSSYVLHGVLVGVLASVIYSAIVIGTLVSSRSAVDLYLFFFPFFLANSVRVLGSVAGAYAAGRRRIAAPLGAGH